MTIDSLKTALMEKNVKVVTSILPIPLTVSVEKHIQPLAINQEWL